MWTRFRRRSCVVLPAILITLLAIGPSAAHAYVGPVAGVGLFSAAIGFLVAFASAIGVILLWPIRVLLRKIRGLTQKPDARSADGNEASAAPLH